VVQEVDHISNIYRFHIREMMTAAISARSITLAAIVGEGRRDMNHKMLE
jgi:hypothetical protein